MRELIEESKKKGVRLMKADLTLGNETAMEWIYSHDRAGVPLYLLYLPGKDALILPEVLSLPILENALAGLPPAGERDQEN